MKTLARMLRALLDAAGPPATVLACVGLLLLGVHVTAEPLVTGARTILDLVDSGLDQLMAWAIGAWASLWDWNPARRDNVIEDAINLVDVALKARMVHALGLLAETILFFAMVPAAWHAQPAPLRLERPDMVLRRAWEGRTPWLKLHAVAMTAMVIPAVGVVVVSARTSAVSFAAAAGLDPEHLGPLGWVAGAVALFIVILHAAIPLVASPTRAAERAGPTRRIVTLLSVPLILAALVAALPW